MACLLSLILPPFLRISLATLFGYGAAIVVSLFFVPRVMDKLYAGCNLAHYRGDKWLARFIGCFECALYVMFYNLRLPTLAIAWLAAKTAVQWQQFPRMHVGRLRLINLIGNGLSLAYSIAAATVAEYWLNRCFEEVVAVLVTLSLATLILWFAVWHHARQASR